MGYTSETSESLPTKLWTMVTQEAMAEVSEKMVSFATASFLCGILKAGNLEARNLELKWFLMGNLVYITAH